jgi:predicted amidohydrolase YtcJ
MRIRSLFASAAIALFLTSCGGPKKVDTLVVNGVIYTVDSSFSSVQAMAIKDGIIVATGTDAEILAAYTAPEKIDAKGQAVYPGFIDAHAHFVGYGKSLFQVDLFGTTSWEEAVERVKVFAAAHPELAWIEGRGWDQNKWPGKKYPTNALLNSLFPNTPVVLQRVDGHAAIANQKAFDMAGVKPGQTIVGGEVETKNGVLTGVLIDNAKGLVYNSIPAVNKQTYTQWLQAAQKNCFAQGLTTVTDCGLDISDINFIDTLQQEGKINMRLFAMLSDNPENLSVYLKSRQIICKRF